MGLGKCWHCLARCSCNNAACVLDLIVDALALGRLERLGHRDLRRVDASPLAICHLRWHSCTRRRTCRDPASSTIAAAGDRPRGGRRRRVVHGATHAAVRPRPGSSRGRAGGSALPTDLGNLRRGRPPAICGSSGVIDTRSLTIEPWSLGCLALLADHGVLLGRGARRRQPNSGARGHGRPPDC